MAGTELMKDTLNIIDLHVRTSDDKKEILKGISLSVSRGEIHAVMGPNGGGKSTLAQALLGHPGFKITKGRIILDGKDIAALAPDERARLGLFLGFQYPVEVAGVNFGNYLRMAINEQKDKKDNKLSPIAFRNELEEAAGTLGFSKELAKRSLNEGFSGGEKKKAEILQLSMLKPRFAVLDEPDSGLDVDALKSIAEGINGLTQDLPAGRQVGLILITHYQRILKYIRPDFVHIIINGRIVKSGDASVAEEVEASGYAKFKSDVKN